MSKLLMSLGLVAGFLVLPGSGSTAAPPVAAAPPCATVAATELAAARLARACKKRVEVTSARSERATVFAEPTGKLTYEASAVPERARDSGGGWATIDLSLHRQADTSFRPNVSVADVRFSGGGNQVVARLGGFGLTWSGILPTPTINGDSAVYPEVLPGVDLVLRATRTGFTHVVVVKTPAAAANPAVRRLRFGLSALSGDVRVRQLPSGTVQAVSGTRIVAATKANAVMWDSPVKAPVSTVAQPGDYARIGKVGLKLEGGELLLTPDLAMLDDPATTYPVYVDPPWDSGFYPAWSYANSANQDNEYSVARVGLSPGQGWVYRSFFEFDVAFLRGRYVANAYVQMRLDHSHLCENSAWSATEMYHTWGDLGRPRTGWDTPYYQWMSRADSFANEGGACAEQEDVWVNFADEKPENRSVTDIVRAYSNNDWNPLKVALRAQYENTKDGWRKFFPELARLIVDYSTWPGQPNGLTVAGVACPGSGRLTIGTLSPALSAVFPDADTDQTLTGNFEWLEIPASGTYDDSTPRKPAPSPVESPANGRATTSALTGLLVGKAYAFRVRTTDPAPYRLGSAWSPWCEFAPDTSRPVKPAITWLSTPGGPGTKVTVKLSTSEPNVAKFRYGFTYPPSLEVQAVNKSATVEVTIPRYGQNTLWAYAVNGVETAGLDASATFTAGRPSPPIAQWGLETYPGESIAQALADRQPGSAGDTPLTATGLSWAADARMIGGNVAAVNGATQLGTPGVVVDSTKSFSVAGWYRKTDTSNERGVLVSQDSATGGIGFALFYYPPYGTWAFLLGGVAQPYALSQAVDWIHVAGVYDAPAREVRLYLNGFLASTHAAQAAPSAAGGKLRIGAASGWTAGAGQTADVRVYDRALVADDFTGKLKSDPTSGGFDEPGMMSTTAVGQWDFEAAVPCYDPNIPYTCEAPDLTAWNRRLVLTTGADIGSGHRGSGLGLDNVESAATAGPVLLTKQAYTVSAWVNLPTGVTGHRTVLSQQDPAGGSAMSLSYNPDDNKWHFWLGEKAGVDFSARTVASLNPAARDTWVHLVGVFDAGSGRLKLYVNGVLQGVETAHTPWHAAGPFVVGSLNWRGLITHHWQGGIDDVTVHRGAMSDAAVKSLYEQQLS